MCGSAEFKFKDKKFYFKIGFSCGVFNIDDTPVYFNDTDIYNEGKLNKNLKKEEFISEIKKYNFSKEDYEDLLFLILTNAEEA